MRPLVVSGSYGMRDRHKNATTRHVRHRALVSSDFGGRHTSPRERSRSKSFVIHTDWAWNRSARWGILKAMKPAINLEQLTQDERLDLIEEIWESLDESQRNAVQLTASQRDELDRRLDQLEREGPDGVTSEELRERLDPPS